MILYRNTPVFSGAVYSGRRVPNTVRALSRFTIWVLISLPRMPFCRGMGLVVLPLLRVESDQRLKQVPIIAFQFCRLMPEVHQCVNSNDVTLSFLNFKGGIHKRVFYPS